MHISNIYFWIEQKLFYFRPQPRPPTPPCYSLSLGHCLPPLNISLVAAFWIISPPHIIPYHSEIGRIIFNPGHLRFCSNIDGEQFPWNVFSSFMRKTNVEVAFGCAALQLIPILHIPGNYYLLLHFAFFCSQEIKFILASSSPKGITSSPWTLIHHRSLHNWT